MKKEERSGGETLSPSHVYAKIQISLVSRQLDRPLSLSLSITLCGKNTAAALYRV